MAIFLRLLKLMGPFRWWILLGVLLSAGTSVASVGLMAVSSYLIAKAAISTTLVDLSLIITGVRFFAISRAALRYAERYINHKATFRILTGLRVWFYTALEPLAPAGLADWHSGDLLTRIVGDIETLENFYLRVLIPPLAAALVTGAACGVLGWFDARLAWALLAFVVLTGVLLPLASRWLSRGAAGAAVALRAELNVALVDAVQGMPDLLAYGQGAAQGAQVAALSRRLHREQERLAWVRGASAALALLLTGLAGLVVLALAVPLVRGGQIEAVYLALLPLTAIAAFEAVQPLAQSLQWLEVSQAAARRVFGVIDTPPPLRNPAAASPPNLDAALPPNPAAASPPNPAAAPPPNPAAAPPHRPDAPPPRSPHPQVRDGARPRARAAPAAPGDPDTATHAACRLHHAAASAEALGRSAPAIEIRGLHFRYAPDEPWVFDGLDLDIAAGGRLALAGANGAGKSTLVNLLLRFWDYEGSIRVGGVELRDIPLDEARALFGVVPQHTHLFHATIRDNLYLANPDATDEQLIEACRVAQLHAFMEGLPGGYDTLVGENGVRLSGGERQRLAVARAILKDAPIIILDEATSQLDPRTEDELLAALGPYLAGRTTIVISHRPAALAVGEKLIYLGPGAPTSVPAGDGAGRGPLGSVGVPRATPGGY